MDEYYPSGYFWQMTTIISDDQSKTIRIVENLVVNYKRWYIVPLHQRTLSHHVISLNQQELEKI